MSAGRATRRELVGGGIAAILGGGLGAAAVSAVALPADGWAASGTGGDSDALTRVLKIEQLVVIAYQKVLAAGTLQPDTDFVIRGLYSHELQHVSTLQRTLLGLGAAIPPPPSDTAAAQRALDAHHVHRSLTQLQTQRNCLKLLIDVESAAEGGYFAAISVLGDQARIRTAAEIMGCEAQHWTILSGLLNRYNVVRSVPYPFVAGSK
jgi:hypothetical protein